MELKLDFNVLENLEENISFDEVKALDIEGSIGATEGASSAGSSLPFPPYFWFTCSA
ncbi:hypothetical protein [Priestia megaterium]|uniref:hypothetical protein n=1 Tax=Priestia megaterium TaxID=1404 RepID=UPI0004AC8837|nr:hypothetical protein [Priestia megaterium]MDR7246882.1 hypothetical protein [Priestia megaterium]